MQTLNILLDTARKMCDRDSDAALAERLDVTRQTVMVWRRGERRITDEHLAKVIELAQADPALAVRVRQEGAESKAERALWGPLWDRLSPVTTTVAGVLLAVGLALPFPSQAASIDGNLNNGPFVHYANWRRRVRAALTRLAAWWRHEPPALLA